MTGEVETGIHQEFERVLDEDDLLDSLFQRVVESDIMSVEGWDDLDDYGTFKITVKQKK